MSPVRSRDFVQMNIPVTLNESRSTSNGMRFLSPEHIVNSLPIFQGARVADLGCGAGYFARPLSSLAHEVLALDIHTPVLSSLEKLRSGITNLRLMYGDVEAPGGTRIKQGFPHVALLSNVLFQLDDKHQALKEAHRIVCPGGRLVVIDWDDSFHGMGPHPAHVVHKSYARDMLRCAGFTIEEDISHLTGPHHYGFVARKSDEAGNFYVS